MRLNCQKLVHDLEQQGAVGQRLLELREEPALVLGIAEEAAAEMIPQPAEQDVVEGLRAQLQERIAAGPQEGAQQDVEMGDGGEFRLLLGEAAEEDVEALRDAHRGAVEHVGADGPAHVALPKIAELGHHVLRDGGDLRRLVAHGAQDVVDDRAERRRLAGALLLREVGADEERDFLRRQEGAQRPAARMAQDIGSGLVALVDVGALLAVDQDVDEVLVEDARDRRIVEALFGHHRAPMAGAVADGEEDRLVLRRRQGQRFRPPGIPVDQIVLVGEQVGAGLLREAVHLVCSVKRRASKPRGVALEGGIGGSF